MVSGTDAAVRSLHVILSNLEVEPMTTATAESLQGLLGALRGVFPVYPTVHHYLAACVVDASQSNRAVYQLSEVLSRALRCLAPTGTLYGPTDGDAAVRKAHMTAFVRPLLTWVEGVLADPMCILHSVGPCAAGCGKEEHPHAELEVFCEQGYRLMAAFTVGECLYGLAREAPDLDVRAHLTALFSHVTGGACKLQRAAALAVHSLAGAAPLEVASCPVAVVKGGHGLVECQFAGVYVARLLASNRGPTCELLQVLEGMLRGAGDALPDGVKDGIGGANLLTVLRDTAATDDWGNVDAVDGLVGLLARACPGKFPWTWLFDTPLAGRLVDQLENVQEEAVRARVLESIWSVMTHAPRVADKKLCVRKFCRLQLPAALARLLEEWRGSTPEFPWVVAIIDHLLTMVPTLVWRNVSHRPFAEEVARLAADGNMPVDVLAAAERLARCAMFCSRDDESRRSTFSGPPMHAGC